MKTNTNRTDRQGNYIGNGSCHADYTVIDFSGYPQVSSSVSLSETTESVYVTYENKENGKTITARFSYHVNNAVVFGDQLDGFVASKDEILYRLGLKTRTFVPDTFLFINKKCVAKKDIEAGLYEFAELTIKEMYDLGKGADLSAYTGKIAKDSNWLIEGNRVEEEIKTSTNFLGQRVQLGRYIYS